MEYKHNTHSYDKYTQHTYGTTYFQNKCDLHMRMQPMTAEIHCRSQHQSKIPRGVETTKSSSEARQLHLVGHQVHNGPEPRTFKSRQKSRTQHIYFLEYKLGHKFLDSVKLLLSFFKFLLSPKT